MKNPSDAVLFGVTIPLSARVFLTTQLNLLVELLPNLHLVYGTEGDGPVTEIDPRVTQHVVPVLRDPSPLQDIRGLVALVQLMRTLRPRMVVMGTPKMGMLGLLAAWIMRVERRVYVLHGLRLEGATGLVRTVLEWMERLTMTCATEVLAVSGSIKTESERLRLAKPGKIQLVGSGSIGGVDLERFRPPSVSEKAAARQRFGVPEDARVVGFLGRLTADKGLADLARVWEIVLERHPEAWLLLVGPDEATPIGDGALISNIEALPNTRFHGPVSDPESVFAAMDVQVFLTRREGFGQVVIEAAASSVPTVATRVSGVTDAVVNHVTGTLVELGDVEASAAAISTYLSDEELRSAHSRAGRERVGREFGSAMVNQRWVNRYVNLLGESA